MAYDFLPSTGKFSVVEMNSDEVSMDVDGCCSMMMMNWIKNWMPQQPGNHLSLYTTQLNPSPFINQPKHTHPASHDNSVTATEGRAIPSTHRHWP